MGMEKKKYSKQPAKHSFLVFHFCTVIYFKNVQNVILNCLEHMSLLLLLNLW